MTTHLPSLESQLKDVNQILKSDNSIKVINKKRDLEAMIAYVKIETARTFYHTFN